MSISVSNTGKQFLSGLRVVILGTSLVQHNTTRSSARTSHWSRGWMVWAKTLGLDVMYDIWDDTSRALDFNGSNQGVSGENSTQIIARLNDAMAMNPDLVILDNGTNEVGVDSVDQMISNTKLIIDTFVSRNIPVVVMPVLARDTASWSSGGNERKKAHALNYWKRNYCQIRRGCYFFDWNEEWVDGSDADGQPKTGYSIDGTHFNVRGAYAVGKKLKDYLNQFIPLKQTPVNSQDDVFDATLNTYGNIHPNGNCVGTAGTNGTGSTGDVATDCRVERSTGTAVTVANTKEVRANGDDYQVMTFTPSGSAEELFLFRTSSSSITHNLQSGDWVRAYCDVDVSAYAGYRGIYLYLRDMGTDGRIATCLEPFDSGGDQLFPSEAWSGTLETPAFQLVSDSTQVRFRVEIIIDGGVAGSPVVKVGSCWFGKVYDPRDVWTSNN